MTIKRIQLPPIFLLLTISMASTLCQDAGSKGSPFKFTPEAEGRRQVFIEAVDHDFKWRLRIPERVFCDEGVLVGHDIRAVHTPVQWTREENGVLVYRRSNRDDTARGKQAREIEYELRITPASFGASLRLVFKNVGKETLHNLTGHVCLGHRSPPFRDPEYQRSYIRREGDFLNLGETDRGSDPIRTHYRIKDHQAIKIFDNTTNRFWGPLSPEIADSGLILTRSTEGDYLAALWFDPAAELFHNCDDSNMCIHSDPTYGDLAPGASVTVEGRLILFQGSLEEFESQYLK